MVAWRTLELRGVGFGSINPRIKANLIVREWAICMIEVLFVIAPLVVTSNMYEKILTGYDDGP